MQPNFEKYMDILENEYSILMKIMTRKGKDEILDCATLANGGVC